MSRTLETRIEALEEQRRTCRPRFAVIQQNEDGTWPPDPPDAALVIAIKRLGGALDPAELPAEVL
jgi:hypothetical protein